MGPPDKASQVTLKVGTVTQGFGVIVDWNETIRNLAAASPEGSKAIGGYLKYYLYLEWKNVKSGVGGNKYKAPPSDTLLENLAEVYNQGNSDLKNKIKAKLVELKSTLGTRPGFLAIDDKAKWDSANKIYETMK